MDTYIILDNRDKKELELRLDDLEYVPIKITSFTNNVGTVEIGRVIDSITFNWALNKSAKTITLDGNSLSPDDRQAVLSDLSITGTKSWALKVTDSRDLLVTASTSISFLNGVYYGSAADTDTYDNAFVLSLTKVLTNTKTRTITVTAGAGKHIYYCVPKRFGTCGFNVGGFDGGFDKVATFEFTNASKYKELYDVYKSTNAGLGSTTVKIT